MNAVTESTSLAQRPRKAPPKAPLLSGGGLLGHVFFMRDDPLGTFLHAREACGPIARVRLGPLTGFFLYEPADVERVLTTNAANYGKSTRGYDKLRLLLGDGLVTSQGEHWLRQRRIAQPAFLRKRVAGLADRMVDAAADMADAWAEPAARGAEIDAHDAMNQLALRIAGETLFSTDVTGEAGEIGTSMLGVLTQFNRLVASPLPWPERWPTPANLRFWRGVRTLHRVVDGLIAERRGRSEQPADLLGLFMDARDPETGEGMTDRQLRDEALTMLLAGHETTANGLSWTLHLLAQYPDAARRVEAELDRVLAGRLPTAADYGALTFTHQVVQESLRLYPPVWLLARRAMADDVLSGYHVPRGSLVFMSQYAIHRDPRLWSDPEGFDPDRFAPDAPAPGRFAYFPFSRGQRQCIGDHFAQMEMVLVLATLLQRYRLASVPGHPVVPEPSVTLRPRDGLRMRLSPRAA